MSTEVRTEVTDGVALLTLSNPARRNALNLELSQKLVDAVEAAAADQKVGAIVVTGEAPAFCAGGDLGELQQADPATLRRVYSGFLSIAACPLPTLAAVNGAAVGAGINLALACDVRLAGPTAKFDVRFMQLGLHPGGGYTWMANRILGAQGAAAMTLFCDVLDATEAQRVGLVWRTYDSDEALLERRPRARRPGRRGTARPDRADQGDDAGHVPAGQPVRRHRHRGPCAGRIRALRGLPRTRCNAPGADLEEVTQDHCMIDRRPV